MRPPTLTQLRKTFSQCSARAWAVLTRAKGKMGNRFLRPLWPGQDREEDEVIAGAGAARLLRDREGRYRLVGGTEADRAELKAWIAKFMANARIEGLWKFAFLKTKK